MKLNWKQYHKERKSMKYYYFNNLSLCENFMLFLSGILNKVTRGEALRIRLTSQCWSERNKVVFSPHRMWQSPGRETVTQAATTGRRTNTAPTAREQAPKRVWPKSSWGEPDPPGWRGMWRRWVYCPIWLHLTPGLGSYTVNSNKELQYGSCLRHLLGKDTWNTTKIP